MPSRGPRQCGCRQWRYGQYGQYEQYRQYSSHLLVPEQLLDHGDALLQNLQLGHHLILQGHGRGGHTSPCARQRRSHFPTCTAEAVTSRTWQSTDACDASRAHRQGYARAHALGERCLSSFTVVKPAWLCSSQTGRPWTLRPRAGRMSCQIPHAWCSAPGCGAAHAQVGHDHHPRTYLGLIGAKQGTHSRRRRRQLLAQPEEPSKAQRSLLKTQRSPQDTSERWLIGTRIQWVPKTGCGRLTSDPRVTHE